MEQGVVEKSSPRSAAVEARETADVGTLVALDRIRDCGTLASPTFIPFG